MRVQHYILIGLVLLMASCSKDKQNAEGEMIIYNEFLIFGKTTKTSDKGFYVMTTDNTFSNKRSVTKVDAEGNKAWPASVFLGYSTGTSTASTVVNNFVNLKEDPSDKGCRVLMQSSSCGGIGSSCLWLYKLSASGTLDHIDSNIYDPFRSSIYDTTAYQNLVIGNDNSVTLLAYLHHSDYYSAGLVKFSLNGDGSVNPNPIWYQEYYISQYNNPTSSKAGPTNLLFISTSDNGYAILASPNGIDHKGAVIKVGADGKEIWRFYNRQTEDITGVADMLENANHDLVIFGKAGRYNVGTEEDFYLYTISGSYGDFRWGKRYNDTVADIPRTITPSLDGGYILTGDQSNYATNGDVNTHVPGTYIYIQKVDANGNKLRLNKYISSFGLHGNDMQPRPDGSYLILGSKHTFGFEEYRDMILMKTLPDGTFNQK